MAIDDTVVFNNCSCDMLFDENLPSKITLAGTPMLAATVQDIQTRERASGCGGLGSSLPRTVVVDHPHEVDQVAPRLGRAQVGHHLLLLRDGEEPRRHLGRHVHAPRRAAFDDAAGLVGGLHLVEQVAQLDRERERLGGVGVVLGGGGGLHGARLGVEEEVLRVERAVALRARHGLRDEQLARAHDLGLERELLERGDEGGRLEDGGDGGADVAGVVGRLAEEDLGAEVLSVHLRGRGKGVSDACCKESTRQRTRTFRDDVLKIR